PGEAESLAIVIHHQGETAVILRQFYHDMGSLGMLFYVVECFTVNLENRPARTPPSENSESQIAAARVPEYAVGSSVHARFAGPSQIPFPFLPANSSITTHPCRPAGIHPPA